LLVLEKFGALLLALSLSARPDEARGTSINLTRPGAGDGFARR
jgi:hypothetical protein